MAEQKLNIRIKAFDKTKTAFRGVTSGLKKVGGAIFSAKSAIAGLVGAAGFGALIKTSMTSIDVMAKTADKIGVTTEALAGLRYAAELTGVSTQTMDMALQRFTRRVSEAANGTGEAVGALEELGINAEDLLKLPLDKQMGVIADSMKKLDTQADRVRVAMKLFDSEGVALVNTLGEGSEALEVMIEEADELGLSLSSIEADKVEEANDAFTRAKAVIQGVVQQFVVHLAPTLTRIANQFVEMSKEANESGNVGERVARYLFDSFDSLRNGLLKVKTAFLNIKLMLETIEYYIKLTFNETIGNAINLMNDIIGLFNGAQINNPFAEAVAESMRDINALKNNIAEMNELSSQSSYDNLTGGSNQQNRTGTHYAPHINPQNNPLGTGNPQTSQMLREMVASFHPQSGDHFWDPMTGWHTFAGGGYTGGGARAGGVDGKGGFPAILHPNETIVDHSQGGGSGVVINQTINISTGVQSTVRAEINNLLPQISDAAKKAVLNAKLRGGSFASQLVGR